MDPETSRLLDAYEEAWIKLTGRTLPRMELTEGDIPKIEECIEKQDPTLLDEWMREKYPSGTAIH